MRNSRRGFGRSTTNARFAKDGGFATTEKIWRRCIEKRQLISTSSIFIGAYLGEELIGFIKMVADETAHAGRIDEHPVEDAAQR